MVDHAVPIVCTDLAPPAVDAAVDAVWRPGTRSGGVLRLARTDDFDSLDPGNTYYGCTWNFLRLLGRTLVTFASAPGAGGRVLVPDLAESLGSSSLDARHWTYTLRSGLAYEDGTSVRAADVAHAVLRSNFGDDVLGAGPTYFRQYLGVKHPGPFRSPSVALPDAIEVVDDRTITFHLRQPFAGFDLLATLPSTTPVPADRDTGAKYTLHPLSTGPYAVHSYVRGQRLVLHRNVFWDQATDLVRRQRADVVEVALGVGAHEVDEMLLAGETHLDLAGFGVQPAAQQRILADVELRANTDNPLTGFTWIFCMSQNVAPLDDIHCRRAVQLATDKPAMQAAYGGSVGGDVATTVLPPTMPGHQHFDRYPMSTDGGPDFDAARAELVLSRHPEGFRTRIAARHDRLKELRAAEALSAGLARVGIEAEVVTFSSGEYFEKKGGCPAFLRENGIGIVMFGWGADFPDGFGFWQQIVDGRAIKPRGNQNMGELEDPVINALLDRGSSSTDPVEREQIWGEIDRLVMEHAVIVPYLYPRSLLYRSPALANLCVSGAFGMYDYASVGLA